MSDLNPYEESLAYDLGRAQARIKELEQAEQRGYVYAKYLAEVIFANGKFDAPHWKPLEDTLGVLTQIDNMVAGIRDRADLCADPALLAEAVEVVEYADRMVKLDLIHMTDFYHEDFSQAVVDTGQRIAAFLSKLENRHDR